MNKVSYGPRRGIETVKTVLGRQPQETAVVLANADDGVWDAVRIETADAMMGKSFCYWMQAVQELIGSNPDASTSWEHTSAKPEKRRRAMAYVSHRRYSVPSQRHTSGA